MFETLAPSLKYESCLQRQQLELLVNIWAELGIVAIDHLLALGTQEGVLEVVVKANDARNQLMASGFGLLCELAGAREHRLHVGRRSLLAAHFCDVDSKMKWERGLVVGPKLAQVAFLCTVVVGVLFAGSHNLSY